MTKLDVNTLMEFFENGRKDGGSFDEGIQFVIERMLVDPDFLLRVYKTPVARTPGGPTLQIKAASNVKAPAYKLSDIDVASRLAFFIWSSIPDDALLTLAEKAS